MIRTLALSGFLATAALLSGPQLAHAATSPTWEGWKSPEEPQAYKISQYLDLGEKKGESDDAARHAEMVIIAAGKSEGIVVGTVFKAFRPKRQTGAPGAQEKAPLWIELGRLKTVEVQEDFSIAMIETQVTPLSRALFPRFPGIMAGDLVVAQRVAIARKQVMTPTVELAYQQLFQDPKATPATFELRPEASAAIMEAAKPFREARLSLLMVEGYTDHNGPASANQIESYQRALTVRQYLIDELGFDEKRVVAIGYGEAEPSDPSLKPGYESANRRIVLKAVAVPPAP